MTNSEEFKVYSNDKNAYTLEKKENYEEIIQKVKRFWDGDFATTKTNYSK
ncbi:MAG: hypothetical protein QCH99_03170 [Candidatus Bathyarchaeota archaeon]|nr:hypothetical protein [Candidatus Bathyarchaeum tardum]WGM88634.1 MAG: hypothetical protein NUK63_06835 [Candidatus Bathyarchaeum tardum]